MSEQTTRADERFQLPEDLMESVQSLSEKFGEPPRFIVMAAVEHFVRIPDEQKKAVLKGTSLRRRGY